MKKTFKPSKARISEAKLREMTEAGMNFVHISKSTGIPVGPLRIAAGVLGISSGSRIDASECFESIKSGRCCNQIAKEIGVTPQAIRIALIRAGLPTTPAAYLRSIAEAC